MGMLRSKESTPDSILEKTSGDAVFERTEFGNDDSEEKKRILEITHDELDPLQWRLDETSDEFWPIEPLPHWEVILEEVLQKNGREHDKELFNSESLVTMAETVTQEAAFCLGEPVEHGNPFETEERIDKALDHVGEVLQRIDSNPVVKFVGRVDAIGRRIAGAKLESAVGKPDFSKGREAAYTEHDIDEIFKGADVNKLVNNLNGQLLKEYKFYQEKTQPGRELKRSELTPEEKRRLSLAGSPEQKAKLLEEFKDRRKGLKARASDLQSTLVALDKADSLGEIQKLVENAHKIRKYHERIIGYLRHLEYKLEQQKLKEKEKEFAYVLSLVGESLGKDSWPSVEAFRQFWFGKVDYMAWDLEDRGEFNATNIKIEIAGADDKTYTILDLHELICKQLPEDSKFKPYIEALNDTLGYVRLTQTARHYMHLARDNYGDPRAFQQALRAESQEDTSYLTQRDFIKNLLTFKDEFEVSSGERARIPVLLYDTLLQINLIQNYEDKAYLRRLADNNWNKRQDQIKEAFGKDYLALADDEKEMVGRTFLLMSQKNMGFISVNQAIFVINNFEPLEPHEMIAPDDRNRIRVATRLMAAAGVVKGNKCLIGVNETTNKIDREWQKYHGIDPTDIEAREEDGEIVYYLGSKKIDEKTKIDGIDGDPVEALPILRRMEKWQTYFSVVSKDLEIDVSGGEVTYTWNGTKVDESTKIETPLGKKIKLLPLLETMEKFGRRAEQPVYEMMGGSFQYFQADTRIKSFTKLVRIVLLRHIPRYDESKYPGYERMDHIALTFIAQTLFSYYQMAKMKMEDGRTLLLSNMLANADYDFRDAEWVRQLLGRSDGLAENADEYLDRTLNVYDAMFNPEEIFGMSFEDMHGKETEEIANVLKDAYKKWKYFVQGMGLENTRTVTRVMTKNNFWRIEKEDKDLMPLNYRNRAIKAMNSGNEDEAEQCFIWSLFFSNMGLWMANAAHKVYDSSDKQGGEDKILNLMNGKQTVGGSFEKLAQTLGSPQAISRIKGEPYIFEIDHPSDPDQIEREDHGYFAGSEEDDAVRKNPNVNTHFHVLYEAMCSAVQDADDRNLPQPKDDDYYSQESLYLRIPEA